MKPVPVTPGSNGLPKIRTAAGLVPLTGRLIPPGEVRPLSRSKFVPTGNDIVRIRLEPRRFNKTTLHRRPASRREIAGMNHRNACEQVQSHEQSLAPVTT
jgi:hypothetical protein